MRNVPNDIVRGLLRHLPLILGNVDESALRDNIRLYNAVRLTRIINKKLSKIEHEQQGGNKKG